MGNERKLIILAASIAFFTTTPIFADEETKRTSFAQDMETVALKEMEDSGTPSLQISIGLGSDIVYEGAFGLADIENVVRATPESKYRAASVAKWFTATAAMHLVEFGVLDLDEPVQKYCPEFPKKQREITSRQLVTHTAGIRHYIDYKKAIENAASPQRRVDLEKKEMQETLSSYSRYTDVIVPLNIFKDDELLFEPGTDWEYSSFGYRLLACVIQGAANTPFEELMENTVFSPADMNDTKPDDAWAIIPNRVTGYRIHSGVVRRADLKDISENLPAGGYLSTASDLVKFAIAFNNGMLTDTTKRIMSSPIAANLDDDSEPSWRDAIPQKDKYGYGLMLFSKYVSGMIGHTGRQAGGSAIVVLIPRKKVSIAVMTNAKGWNGYLNFITKIERLLESAIKLGTFNKALQRTSR
jgi:CubicO group peptidase (beta-lactamase class C family)